MRVSNVAHPLFMPAVWLRSITAGFVILAIYLAVSACKEGLRPFSYERRIPDSPDTLRILVVGNSEANGILPSSPKAFHMWEGAATLVDRLVQMHSGLNQLPNIELTISNLNPLELVADPECLTHRRLRSAPNSPNAGLVAVTNVAHAVEDLPLRALTVRHLLVSKAEVAFGLDPVRLWRRAASPQKTEYRINGSVVRRPEGRRDANLPELGRVAELGSCIGVASLNTKALALMEDMQALASVFNSRLLFVVTPLHPKYRRALHSLLAGGPTDPTDVLQELLFEARRAGFQVRDDSARLDGNDAYFLDGDHLASEGEAAYEAILKDAVP